MVVVEMEIPLPESVMVEVDTPARVLMMPKSVPWVAVPTTPLVPLRIPDRDPMVSAVVVTPPKVGEEVAEMFWGNERVTVPVAEETDIWFEVPWRERTPLLVKVTVPGAEVAMVRLPPLAKV